MLNMKKLLTKILTGFVKKTGDTMTGNLTLEMRSVYGKNTDLAIGDTPSSNAYRRPLVFTDKNNAILGYSGCIFYTDGGSGVQLEAARTVSGSGVYHGVRLKIASNGTRSVSVNDAAAWRAGLGVPGTAVATTSANGLMSSSDKTAVNKINNTMFKYKKYTYAYTVAGNSNVEITANNLGISVPSGYRVAGVYYAAPGKAAVSVDLIAADNTGTGNVIRLRNHSSSSQSGKCTVGITWVKTDFISAL